jgi:hypothetical protein
MTLKDIQTVINTLSLDEIRELEVYLAQRKADLHPGRGKTPEERARLFEEAMAEIRAGLSQAELDQLTSDMNSKYVEDVDVDQWKD